MNLINKLFGKPESAEDQKAKDRRDRVLRNRKKLVQFLTKVGRKPEKAQAETYNDIVDAAGKKAYELLKVDYPEYEKIDKTNTPKKITEKEKRDNKICNLAEKFIDFVDFMLDNSVHTFEEYGMIDVHSPIYSAENPIEYNDKAAWRITEKLNLPTGYGIENIQKLKNISLSEACQKIESNLEGFTGYITYSSIAKEIAETPGQLSALDNFITGVCRDIRNFLDDDQEKDIMQKHYELRQKTDLPIETKEVLDSYKKLLNKYLIKYNKEAKELRSLGVSVEDNLNGFKAYVQKIIDFVAETGKYAPKHNTPLPEPTTASYRNKTETYSDPNFGIYREREIVKHKTRTIKQDTKTFWPKVK